MSRDYPDRVPGVRNEYDSTDGVWAYMLDRSESEGRIYFEQYDAWVTKDDYSSGFRAWSSERPTGSDQDYVAYVFDYCLKNGNVYFTSILDTFTEGFIDAL